MRSLLTIASLAFAVAFLSACSGGSQSSLPPSGPSQSAPQQQTSVAQSSVQQNPGEVVADARHILYPPVGLQRAQGPFGGGTNNLLYNGGPVMNNPKVYVVYWGWTGDPSAEQQYLRNYLSGVGGSSWLNTVTQYYSGAQTFITNPSGQLGGEWSDNTNLIPSHPSDSDIAAEAARAAAQFAISGNNVMVMVATPHGNSTRGFGVRWCAYHSSTSNNLAYTNFPYMTDAGTSCGANFINGGLAGLLDGVSIVGGHEYAEAITDVFPSSGWLDKNGSENGDKCAWSTRSGNITLSTGTFAVQPLWSNASSGCVMSY
jgi:hypothetical protein